MAPFRSEWVSGKTVLSCLQRVIDVTSSSSFHLWGAVPHCLMLANMDIIDIPPCASAEPWANLEHSSLFVDILVLTQCKTFPHLLNVQVELYKRERLRYRVMVKSYATHSVTVILLTLPSVILLLFVALKVQGGTGLQYTTNTRSNFSFDILWISN